MSFGCNVCLHRLFETGEAVAGPAHGELGDEGVVKGSCPAGHECMTVLQQPRYEILFDMACLALSDGYAREAVASFTASLERFYETAIRVMCAHSGATGAVFETPWKQVAKQSQAQMGAFLLLFAAVTREELPAWSNALTNTRNEVVHNGRFPTTAAAINYGEACYKRIHGIAATLKLTCPDAWWNDYSRQLAERKMKWPAASTFLSVVSPVGTVAEGAGTLPFSEAAERCRRHAPWLRGKAQVAPGGDRSG